MDNYEELVGIKTRFENSTESELHSYLYSFENKWIQSGNKNINNLINRSLENFGLPENFTYEELNTNYKKCLYNVIYLQLELGNSLSDDKNDEFVSLVKKAITTITELTEKKEEEGI